MIRLTSFNMLATKEKLEDTLWLEDLLFILQRNPDNTEVQTEIERIKTKLATYNYTPLERRRQASFSRLGRESAYY